MTPPWRAIGSRNQKKAEKRGKKKEKSWVPCACGATCSLPPHDVLMYIPPDFDHVCRCFPVLVGEVTVMGTVYCVLCTVYCVLCTVYCVLCTVYCVLCTVYCVLCTVYCVLCTVYWLSERPENDPCLRVWVHILRKFKSPKFCPFFRISPTTARDFLGNVT